MAWTYDVSLLDTDKATQVRYLVGDTNKNDQLVQDEEIAFALKQSGSIWRAAATVCRAISAKLSRESDVVERDLRTMMTQRATAYSKRAAEYDNKAAVKGGGLPFAGGISRSDRAAQNAKPDRVPPEFAIGMTDSYDPVAPVDGSR